MGLLSGWAYYPGEFYVVLFNKMSREKLGLWSGWAYYPGAYKPMSTVLRKSTEYGIKYRYSRLRL